LETDAVKTWASKLNIPLPDSSLKEVNNLHSMDSLLQTIRLPKNLNMLNDRLPLAQYEDVESVSDHAGSQSSLPTLVTLGEKKT